MQSACELNLKNGHMLSRLTLNIRPIVFAITLLGCSLAGVLCETVAYSKQPTTKNSIQSAPSVDWLTGTKLDRFNQSSLSVSWAEAPLKARLKNYAKLKKTAIFLDRRVDPSLSMNLIANSVSPEQFLWAAADSQELGVCRVGDVYYFGPQKTTASLPTIWSSMTRETSRQKRAYKVDWSSKNQLTTDTIVEPKQLLEKIAKENNFVIENLDELPHDLWAKVQLPTMSLDGQVGIILVGFDKWFERSEDGKSIKIVDFEEVKVATLTVRRSINFPEPRKVADKLREEHPTLKISANKQRLSASGPPLELAKLKSTMVKMQVTQKVDPDLIRFNVTTTAARLTFLRTIAAQSEKKLVYDPSLQKQLEEVIALKLKNVSLTELLEASIEGTGLKHEMKSTELRVFR